MSVTPPHTCAVFAGLVAGLLVTSAWVTGCSGDDGAAARSTTTTPAASSTPPSTGTVRCPVLDPAQAVGRLGDPTLVEASGLAASRRNPGVLWSITDGESPTLFAMDEGGRALARFRIDGARPLDVEDIAVGPGTRPGTSDVFLADIGGNSGRNQLKVYRLPEPAVDAGAPVAAGAEPPTTTVDAVRIDLAYPEDASADAEAFVVDPRTGDWFVITKRLDGDSRVDRLAAADATPGRVRTLERVGTLGLPLLPDPLVTAADISPDGSMVAVRTYRKLYLYPRAERATVAEALQGERCAYDGADEPQGESIAFSADGRDLFSTSEGVGAVLFRTRRNG
ncbi:MAG: hypothetical protein ACOYOP_02145 [Microthrixaceae bacterium]